MLKMSIPNYYYYIIGGVPLFLWLVRKYCNRPLCSKTTSQERKLIIVTGSSAGIGKETAFDLLRHKADVVFACRDEKKTRAVISEISDPDARSRAQFMKLDLCNVDSIINFNKEFRSKYENRSLDILINNAGLINDTFTRSEGIERTIMANHIGHKILTLLLLDKLNSKEARIINLSSVAHTLSDYTVEGLRKLQTNLSNEGVYPTYTYKTAFNTYGNSKLGNIFFTRYLAEKLSKSHPNLKITSVHPGGVNTEFSRYLDNSPALAQPFLWLIVYPIYWLLSKDCFVGAQPTLQCVYDDFENIQNGAYYQDCKVRSTGEIAKNDELYREFMKYSWLLVNKVTEGKVNIREL